ncbi:T9SS type A sorting domain-containing protein [Marivirga sp.]|uniref:T9SS type A sorting domain-containing protein n=1 Tax=Marivirga sp. TaxID=2018662 RepID=UPI002D7E43C7|nr:T9SS type A sorting domain-containing protein [Marivirga sp.]HET8858941.1 T9SS type A sorting domain-containing protein [Marivirga sp.]
MENIILQKTRYLKAMLLTLFVGFFAFGASAQVFISSTPPATPWYAGQEATVSYEAETFAVGTSFILWDDADNDAQIDEDEQIFGQSTVQDALEEIDFSWPEAGNVNLRFAAFSGNSVTGEVIAFTNADVAAIGTNSGGNFLTFDRASARFLTTNAIDLDTSEPVVLSLTYDGAFASGPDANNPVEVLYSTDGFATAGTALIDDNLAVDEFENIFQVLEFTLPNGAKTANTSFRIQQTGTVNYNTDKNWQVRTSPAAGAIQVEIGKTYANIADEFVDNNNVLLPELTINNVLDADDVAGGNIYPGDGITVEAELQGIDLTDLDFAVRLTNTNTGETFLLESQVDNFDNVTKEITVEGDVPTNISYYNAGLGWNVDIYAYDGNDILFGTSEFYDFTGGLPTDFEQIGGGQDGSGLTFDEAGDRSITTVPYNISTESDGVLTFNASRANDVLSPAGTDLIVEYSTDGETYTELTSVDLNSLSFGGSTEVIFDAWPAGVVSGSTQFRIRQVSNNGAGLDAFIIEDLDIQSGTNLISESFIGRGLASVAATVQSPNITINNLDVGGDGLAFPMEALTLTYDITDGAFPANTEATVLVQRTGDPDFDIIIGETTDISGESIAITVPPLEAGDYTVYIATLNGETYFSTTLSIFDLGLNITSVEYNDPVMVAGDEFTYPGSAITVNYTLQGTAGAGAELMVSVYDNNPEVDDWVMIGSTTTLDGAVTATLPTGIDYDTNPDVRLSIGTSGTYDNLFYETIVSEDIEGDPLPSSIFESSTGTSNNFPSKPDSFTGSGERSATTVPFDFSYGGRVDIEIDEDNGIHLGTYDVKLQGSIDGTNWVDLDEEGVGAGSIVTLFANVPNSLWSANTQFRVIYNEDGAYGINENVIQINEVIIETPEFMEASFDDEPFNLIRPSLAVSDYDKTAFVMGEEVSINYNAVGFPAATEYAAVVEQGGEYYVAGTSADEGAATIIAVMPIAFEDPMTNYSLTIVPFEPATAGGDYKQGETLQIDNEEDFLVISGQDPSWANSYSIFDFDQIGDRELLTKAYDLSGTSSATLNFNFNNTFGYGNFDVNANKNTVPRLEISTDGGATFQVVPVYELEEGEEQIYDDGLLYLQQGYSVELPASALTAATHFRFSQPLNLGADANRWSVANLSLTLNDDNRLPDFQFDDNINGNNPETINITAPDLNGYAWMQADLDDAVFNGETFQYSFNIADGFNATDIDAFPAGTEFTFTLNGVTDPDTGEDAIIGTTTALGTFEGNVPLYAGSGNFTINISASMMIEGEEFFFYEDQGFSNLEVFNQVLKTTFNGDANGVYYAGNEVTVDYAFENDLSSTTNTEIGDLVYNLILEFDGQDWLLAVDETLTGSFTVDMPPFVNENYGAVDFEVRASVGGPLGVIGEALETSSIGFLDDAADWINDDVALEGFPFGLPGAGSQARLLNVSGQRVFTSTDFDLVEANAARLSFNLYLAADNFPTAIEENDVLENQQLIFEYSTDGGATYTEIETFLTEGDENGDIPINLSRNYLLDGDILSTSTRFRFRQDESRFIIGVEDMQIVAADEAQIEYVSADDNGFVPSIKPQAFQITSVGATEACISDDITLNYEIRGKFGADNEVTVQYTGDNDIPGVFNLIEGSGSIDVSLPTDILNAGDNNQDFKFRLQAEDRTFDDLGYTTNVNGTYTETNVEVVAPIDIDSDFNVDNQQLCDVQDVMVTIISPRDYFTYQVIDALSGDAIGSPLTYDPDLGENEINLGELTDEVRLGLEVTSASSSGTTCNTITSTYEFDFFAQPNFVLFMNNIPVEAGTTMNTCGQNISLTASYFDNNGNVVSAGAGQVEWFRNNLQTPITTNSTLSLNNSSRSGDYFARVTDGSCIYTTESITIESAVRPEQPQVTVVSGDLVSCDADNEVVLQGPEGFAVYQWTRPGQSAANVPVGTNQRKITIRQSGTYQLRVSNAAEANNCSLSNFSEPVTISNAANDQVVINIQNFGQASPGQVYDVCDNTLPNVSAEYSDGVTPFTNENVTWFKDGVEYEAQTNANDSVTVTESGVYYAEVTNGQCSFTTPEVTFNVLEAPETAPTLTFTGDLTFCDGEGSVVLEGPEGFNYYQWNGVQGSGAITNGNTIEVTQAGTYTLQVGNVSDDGAVSCLSPVSNTVTVNSRALPSVPPLFNPNGTPGVAIADNSCGDGPVTFVLTNGVSNNVSYQLINAATDQPSGVAVTGNGANNTFLTSDVITEETTFYIEATYADGSGCTVSYPETRTFSATPNNVTLEVEGNQLIASYNSGISDVRWYRDGVLLTNVNTSTFSTSSRITISDAAEYSIEVEYASGCIVTASSADITGKILANRDAMAMKVVSYPNPALSDVTLNVHSQYMGQHEVIITSMTGQVMMQSKFEKSSFEANHALNIASLEKGIYNVQIRHDGLSQNVRIIKK